LLPDRNAKLDPALLLAGGVQALTPGEVIMYKPRWGAFYQTPLDTYLKQLGISTLIFSGCNFPNCPRTSMYEASERDYRIVLVTDAISGLYDRGLQEIQNIGVKILSSDETIAALKTRKM